MVVVAIHILCGTGMAVLVNTIGARFSRSWVPIVDTGRHHRRRCGSGFRPCCLLAGLLSFFHFLLLLLPHLSPLPNPRKPATVVLFPVFSNPLCFSGSSFPWLFFFLLSSFPRSASPYSWD